MYSTKVEPKYNSSTKPKIGLIALATDFMIEKDFINVTKDMDIDLFVNRIHCHFPLTSENLIKMSNTVTEVSKDILPDEKLDCVVYGCTSGTIAAGYDSIKNKVKLAKPEAKVITPSTAAINALKKMNINKISIFTPYSKKLNDYKYSKPRKTLLKCRNTVTVNATIKKDKEDNRTDCFHFYRNPTLLVLKLLLIENRAYLWRFLTCDLQSF